jgi:hypothetical protein
MPRKAADDENATAAAIRVISADALAADAGLGKLAAIQIRSFGGQRGDWEA